MRTLAVLLAAGAGSRFAASSPGAGHKLLALVRGRPVVDHALSAMCVAGLDGCAVITGAVDLTGVVGDVARDRSARIDIVHNSRWETGQRSSLLAAIDHARTGGYDAVVVGLGDQPFVTPGAWRAVAASNSPIAVASYGGRRGNPVRLHSSVWDDLAEPTADPDSGARSLVAAHPELVQLVECDGSDDDIDTVDDLDLHR